MSEREIYHKNNKETDVEYKKRLYANKKRYGLDWQDIKELLGSDYAPDNIRKMSYGYLDCVKDYEAFVEYDKSIMVLNDIHLPFERKDILDIIAKHKDEINVLVINGDLMDCFEISSFDKNKKIDFTFEMTYTHNFLQQVRDILSNNQKIILLRGNHEDRWGRLISRMKEESVKKLLNPEILETIINGFSVFEDNISGKKEKKYKQIENIEYISNWYINLDEKLVICHPQGFSQVDGRMCEKVGEHFLNLNSRFDVCVFGHTHKYTQMTVSRRKGVYVLENGCMCQPQGYANKLGFTPQDSGYCIIKYNNDESIGYNNIRFYHLDNDVLLDKPVYI